MSVLLPQSLLAHHNSTTAHVVDGIAVQPPTSSVYAFQSGVRVPQSTPSFPPLTPLYMLATRVHTHLWQPLQGRP